MSKLNNVEIDQARVTDLKGLWEILKSTGFFEHIDPEAESTMFAGVEAPYSRVELSAPCSKSRPAAFRVCFVTLYSLLSS